MNIFEQIKCHTCLQELRDFVMLPCGHNICDQCLQANKSITSQVISISCKCGLLTNIPKKRNQSPRSSLCSLNLNQTLSTLNNKTPIVNKTQSLILNETHFQIQKPKKQTLQTKIKQISKSAQFLNTQLQNQIKFIQIKFDRYLNEATRNFNKLIASMKSMFGQFKSEARIRCQDQIMKMKVNNIIDISKNIGEAFHRKIEDPLVSLSNMITKYSNEIVNWQYTIQRNGQQQNIYNIYKKTENTKKSSSKKKTTSINGHTRCKISSEDLLSPHKHQNKANNNNKNISNCQNLSKFHKKTNSSHQIVKKIGKTAKYRV